MRAKPYLKYKHSGVQWLGDVPEHWESKRFGYLFRFYSGGTPSTNDSELWSGEIPWVSSKDMKALVVSDTEDHISEEAVRQSATCKLPAGSLLIVNRSGILKHSIPAAINTREMAINQDIRGCVPLSGVDSKFIVYLIEGNQPALLALWRQQGATVESLTFESLKTTNLHLPNLSEQRAIAAFLDRETGRINTLIAKKRELVKRLKEKRTALISRTVTRGLVPSAPLKSCDVDWIGHVPQHWVTKKVTYGFSMIGSGTTPKSDNNEYYEGSVPWVTTSELRETLITKTKQTVSKSAIADYSALRLYPPATLLFAMYGATIGRLGILGISATLNQACCAFAESTLFDTRFVFYWLWMRRPILISLSSGGGQPNLSQDDLRQIRIPKPPLPEQAAIAEYLEKETTKLDTLVAKVDEAVERLQEYRTALITAAVTGKINVNIERM